MKEKTFPSVCFCLCSSGDAVHREEAAESPVSIKSADRLVLFVPLLTPYSRVRVFYSFILNTKQLSVFC